MGIGRPTNGRLQLKMTIEHGTNLLFPIFTWLNNNLKERLDLKDMLQQLRALMAK